MNSLIGKRSVFSKKHKKHLLYMQLNNNFAIVSIISNQRFTFIQIPLIIIK